jgi:dTMP kinase
MSGTFIVLEGPDGSGTTTLSRMLAEKLISDGKEAVLTKEPTDGVYGKKLREDLSNKNRMPPKDFQKIFCDDRAEHLESIVNPALNDGKFVVSDRYYHSTFIYGSAEGVPMEELEEMNKEFPAPGLTIFALPPFEVCKERIHKRESRDAYEQDDFMRKVYEGYKKYSDEHQDIVVVDTSKSPEENIDEIVHHLNS